MFPAERSLDGPSASGAAAEPKFGFPVMAIPMGMGLI